MNSKPTIVWFRQDLRLQDNPALMAAILRGGLVIPLYIWAPKEEGAWPPGAAARWWLHYSLESLDRELRNRGSRLIIREGESLSTLRDLIAATGATSIFWNRRYEPTVRMRDEEVAKQLSAEGVLVESFHGSLLLTPEQVRTRSGFPFQVFTPFWKRCTALLSSSECLTALYAIPTPGSVLSSATVAGLRLLPEIDWAVGLRAVWQPGELGAATQLQRFLEDEFASYPDRRNRPAPDGTSRLSPHLHFGEIGPRQIWNALTQIAQQNHAPDMANAAECYLRQLGWREFAYHLLHHFPQTTDSPLKSRYADFPWQDDVRSLKAWQRGRTGYPIVDAGMRQLWATGWMHNRIRMVVASFLVTDLLLPWQHGARWFWDTLVDADPANNTLGWQWAAGCGADAAPYFRIFNPVMHGEKYDPTGAYVRRWVPELQRLPATWIHHPWDAPEEALQMAGIVRGETYPHPIVDHSFARQRALSALRTLRDRKD